MNLTRLIQQKEQMREHILMNHYRLQQPLSKLNAEQGKIVFDPFVMLGSAMVAGVFCQLVGLKPTVFLRWLYRI